MIERMSTSGHQWIDRSNAFSFESLWVRFPPLAARKMEVSSDTPLLGAE